MSNKNIENFNPNGVGLNNGHFIGLPFEEEDARIVILPVPWDVTVSFADGTATASRNILKASYQLDLYDEDVVDAWKIGIYLRKENQDWLKKNKLFRELSQAYIKNLEDGKTTEAEIPESLNLICKELNQWVYEESKSLLQQGKLVGILGGEHSVPLGYLKALAEQHENFGVLQIDAHMDLRKAYEGFEYSHASIFYNAMQIENISKLIQVGVRDFCEEEVELIKNSNNRIAYFSDQYIRTALYKGISFDTICETIIQDLPRCIYISFDIDGLNPALCPNTGTPVPGGLDFNEAIYLIKKVVESGRQIIGFDLCEVAGEGHEWDGNVGARVLYKLSNLMYLSTKK